MKLIIEKKDFEVKLLRKEGQIKVISVLWTNPIMVEDNVNVTYWPPDSWFKRNFPEHFSGEIIFSDTGDNPLHPEAIYKIKEGFELKKLEEKNKI